MAVIPKKVRDRLAKQVANFQKVLREAKDRDVNEADTVTIVTDMLASVFGYDKYSEVTSEYLIRGTYCDLAVKINDTIQYLIEVKAIGLDLKQHHLRQTVNYAANKGVHWCVLTNGLEWQIYRLRFDAPIGVDLVCSFNFLELRPKKTEDQKMLFVLCKKGISKAAIEEFHEHVQIVNRLVIGAIVQTEPVVSLIRRELRRMAEGVKVQQEEIEKILVTDVLKRDVVEGDAAEQAKSRVKKAAGKAIRKKKSGSESSAG